MTNQVVLAVAGGGKTESIVRRCKENPRRRLLVTYTTTGQEELRSRLFRAECADPPEVVGWYAFLMQHFLRPYYPSFRPGSSFPGFNYKYRAPRGAAGDRYFSDGDGKIGKERLAYIAREVHEDSNGAPVRRLEKIYEEIVFDEVQDFVASDLVILEWLLKSSMTVHMVGDLRQTVFETTTSDRKYPNFRGAKKIGWFTAQEQKGLLDIKRSTENYRCSADVVTFANRIFDPSFGFAEAISLQHEQSSHMGLYRVSTQHAQEYAERYSPLTLRWNKSSASEFNGKIPMKNFGQVKGITAEHVLIYPTGPMKQFLASGMTLADEAAAKLYVGVTRAKFSVAFILEDTESTNDLIAWSPKSP